MIKAIWRINRLSTMLLRKTDSSRQGRTVNHRHNKLITGRMIEKSVKCCGSIYGGARMSMQCAHNFRECDELQPTVGSGHVIESSIELFVQIVERYSCNKKS